MKNKMILSISLLLLSACSVSHNKLSDVSQDSLLVSQFSESATDLVLEKEAKYRNDLIQARDKQKAYINSLSIEE